MNKFIYIGTICYAKTKGAAILLTVVLLLIMVTLVTLYTGKIQSFEHRIALNEQNQKWANASANAGLENLMARLAVTKTLIPGQVDGVLADNSQFAVTGLSQNVADGRQLVTLNSTGYSADGLASASVSEQALIYPLLANIPPAPVLIKNGFSPDGEFEIVLNPDGLGASTPLSLWSDVPVVLVGTQHHSCYMAEFSTGHCLINSFSNHSYKKLDIADNSANFPTDLLSYLFNIPQSQWPHLRELTDFELPDCHTLDIGSWGFVWVNGDCEITASTQVATQSQPIILIVFNGRLILQSNVTAYGLVFSLQLPGSSAPVGITMHSQALVQGFVIANYQLGVAGDNVRVVFNQQVAEQLKQNSKLHRVARVPGSWRDF
jgi:hypothetical protein